MAAGHAWPAHAPTGSTMRRCRTAEAGPWSLGCAPRRSVTCGAGVCLAGGSGSESESESEKAGATSPTRRHGRRAASACRKRGRRRRLASEGHASEASDARKEAALSPRLARRGARAQVVMHARRKVHRQVPRRVPGAQACPQACAQAGPRSPGRSPPMCELGELVDERVAHVGGDGGGAALLQLEDGLHHL